MKKNWNKTTTWHSILSVLILGIFIMLAWGSDFSQQKKDLGDGIWEESKNFSNGKVETITGKVDNYGNWTGPVKIIHENEDKELAFSEEVSMVDGMRHGISKITYANGVVIEHCYDMGVRKVCEKSAFLSSAENSAFSKLSYKYPWFQHKLNALNYSPEYMKAYMDTVETLMYKKDFKAAEFDTNYNDVLDSLRESRFDSIITFNSELSMYQGLDLMKISQFRMAVIDHYRTPESTTYSIINQTYPGYLRELNDSGVVNSDFEIFCKVNDSIMTSYGALQPVEPYFLDSIDARLYRSLITIINTDKSVSISTRLALKSASLKIKNTNLLKFYAELKSIMNPLSLSSTPTEVGTIVMTLMLFQYIDGDLLRKSFLEACYLKKNVVRMPVVTTSLESSSTSNSAVLRGNVIEDGGAPVLMKGMAWSTRYNPTVLDHTKTSGAGIGEFTIDADGLIKGTTYYARSYATNSSGTAYGNCISFVAGNASGLDEELENTPELMIYPNPTSGPITIQFMAKTAENTLLSILDLKGQVVWSTKPENLQPGETKIEINLSQFPNGLYYCQLTNGSSTVKSKLMIVR